MIKRTVILDSIHSVTLLRAGAVNAFVTRAKEAGVFIANGLTLVCVLLDLYSWLAYYCAQLLQILQAPSALITA